MPKISTRLPRPAAPGAPPAVCAWQLMRADGRPIVSTSDVTIARMWREKKIHSVRALVPAPEGTVW